MLILRYIIIYYFNLKLEYISPSLMIPKHRLETLVEQSLQFQESNCLYHNTNETYIPIYTDHKCLKFVNHIIFIVIKINIKSLITILNI